MATPLQDNPFLGSVCVEENLTCAAWRDHQHGPDCDESCLCRRDVDSNEYTLVVTAVQDRGAWGGEVEVWDVRLEVELVGIPADTRSARQVADQLLGKAFVLKADQ